MTTSKSVRLLAAVLCLGAIVAAATTGPSLLRSTQSVVDVQPQLLEVDEGVKGLIRLSPDLTVSLYDSGLQVRRDGRVIFETVRIGSILSAGRGEVTGAGDQRAERVASSRDSWHVQSVQVAGSTATYSGPMLGSGPPLRAVLSVRPSGQGAQLRFSVPGAQFVAVHTERPQAPLGLVPALPDRSLSKSAWWVALPAGRGSVPLMTSAVRGNRSTTTLVSGIATNAAPDLVLDLRHGGRGDLRVWAPELVLQVA